jgi:hypothetical protein
MMGKSLCMCGVPCNPPSPMALMRAPARHGLLLVLAALTAVSVRSAPPDVPRWGVFEASFTSVQPTENPLQDMELRVTFRSPTKRVQTVQGFWDGATTWRVRFSPEELGEWTFTTSAIPASDSGLHGQKGTFRVVTAKGATRFDHHGPVRVSRNRRFLEHADGAPFFWLADTGWNAALLSTPEEFDDYVAQRSRQRFTAVQWVTTQWRASPGGDRLNELAYTGRERIAINPQFFQRLDAKVNKLNQAGLLSASVLLWAIAGGSDPTVNPGVSLPEDQAIKLAQYMVARWQGNDVLWILPGDGDYRGEKAEKWKRIGRAVFSPSATGSGQAHSTDSGEAHSTGSGQALAAHAPVVLHPGGMQWVLREFQQEPWLDIQGYQSGHGDDEKTLRWMTEGPPAKDWTMEPARPFINLEPPYENHLAYQSRTRIAPLTVRRAVYWSLLNAPTAGVTYGGHGVWGWDDGTKPPTDHAGSGIPLPWKEALVMPGGEQMAHVASLFTSIDFWRLRPTPDVLAEQPGKEAAARFIAAAGSDRRDLLVVYTPEVRTIAIKSEELPRGRATWHNPRTGELTSARGLRDGAVVRFEAPSDGDWVLVVK